MSDIAGRISPALPVLRFVVLKHSGIDVPHFDLMFETFDGSPLVTWRSPLWPISVRTLIIRVADHRREYLDIEGDISGNRGYVQRIARGYFNPVHISDGYWRITIRDLMATTELEFQHEADEKWHIQPKQI